jgi:hypothetical protein
MSKYLTPVLVLVVAVLAVALFVRGGEVLTALAISATNSSAATVNITNTAPQVFNVRCFNAGTNDQLTTANKLSLLGGDFKTIYCNATIIENNGFGDITAFYGSVHENIATNGDLCAEDVRWCYQNNTCENNTNINTTAEEVRCTFKLWFNADNTTVTGNWTGNITVKDTSSNVAYNNYGLANRTNFSVDTLLAVGVDSLIAFGAKSAGTNMTNLGSTGTVSATVCAGATNGCNHSSYNYGNTQIDLQINGSAMTCSQAGSIPAGFIMVSTTYNTAYSSGYPLTATLSDSTSSLNAFNLAENNVASATAPLATSGQTYWGVGIPLSAAGNCQGVIHFAAVLG